MISTMEEVVSKVKANNSSMSKIPRLAKDGVCTSPRQNGSFDASLQKKVSTSTQPSKLPRLKSMSPKQATSQEILPQRISKQKQDKYNTSRENVLASVHAMSLQTENLKMEMEYKLLEMKTEKEDMRQQLLEERRKSDMCCEEIKDLKTKCDNEEFQKWELHFKYEELQDLLKAKSARLSQYQIHRAQGVPSNDSGVNIEADKFSDRQMEEETRVLIANLENKFSDKQMEEETRVLIANLENQLEQLNREISMEQSERKAAEEAGKSAEMTLQMLNVEIADKDQLINKKDECLQKLEEELITRETEVICSKDTIRCLEIRCADIQSKLDRMEGTLADRNDQLEQLNRKLSIEQSERKAAEEAAKSAQMTLQMLNVEIADKDKVTNQRSEYLQKLEEELITRETEVNCAKDTIKCLEIRCKEFQDKLHKIESTLAERNERTETLKEDLTAEKENADDRIRCLELECEKFQNELDKMNYNLEEKNDLIEQLNRQISVGQSEKKAVEVAAEEALEEAAKDAEMAIQMLNVELAEKDTVINKRNEQICKLEGNLQELEGDLQAIRTEKDPAQNDVKASIHEFDELRKELNKMAVDLKENKDHVQILIGELESRQHDAKIAEQVAESKHNEMERKIAKMAEISAQKEECLADLKKQLKIAKDSEEFAMLQFKAIESDMFKMIDVHDKNKGHYENLCNELKELHEDKAILQEDLCSAETKFQQASKEITKMTEIITENKECLADLKKQLKIAKDSEEFAMSQFKAIESDMFKMIDVHEKNKGHYENLCNELKELHEDKAILQEDLCSAETKFQQASKEITKITEIITENKGAHASLHKELKHLEEEKSTLQNNLSSAETKAAKATKELIKLTEMLAQKEGQLRQFSQFPRSKFIKRKVLRLSNTSDHRIQELEDPIKKLNEKLDEKNAEIGRLKEENMMVDLKRKLLADDINRKKKEINVLQDEKLKIMNEFTEFSQESVTQHHEILKDKETLEEELRHCESERRASVQELTGVSMELEVAHKTINILMQERESIIGSDNPYKLGLLIVLFAAALFFGVLLM